MKLINQMHNLIFSLLAVSLLAGCSSSDMDAIFRGLAQGAGSLGGSSYTPQRSYSSSSYSAPITTQNSYYSETSTRKTCFSCLGSGRCGMCSGSGVRKFMNYASNSWEELDCAGCNGGMCNICKGSGRRNF